MQFRLVTIALRHLPCVIPCHHSQSPRCRQTHQPDLQFRWIIAVRLFSAPRVHPSSLSSLDSSGISTLMYELLLAHHMATLTRPACRTFIQADLLVIVPSIAALNLQIKRYLRVEECILLHVGHNIHDGSVTLRVVDPHHRWHGFQCVC